MYFKFLGTAQMCNYNCQCWLELPVSASSGSMFELLLEPMVLRDLKSLALVGTYDFISRLSQNYNVVLIRQYYPFPTYEYIHFSTTPYISHYLF